MIAIASPLWVVVLICDNRRAHNYGLAQSGAPATGTERRAIGYRASTAKRSWLMRSDETACDAVHMSGYFVPLSYRHAMGDSIRDSAGNGGGWEEST